MSDYTAITNPAEALAIVRKAARGYSAAGKKIRSMTADAAYATDLAYRNGLIGKGQAYGTARDYALAFDVSPATVTLWKRLGRALIVGVTTDSEVWQRLAFQSIANRASVAETILADDATVEKITTAVAACYDAEGVKIPVTKTAKPNDGTDKDTDTDGLSAVTDPFERVVLLIGMVDKSLLGTAWTVEQWGAIETKLHTMEKREVTLLAKRVKDAKRAAGQAAPMAEPDAAIAS